MSSLHDVAAVLLLSAHLLAMNLAAGSPLALLSFDRSRSLEGEDPALAERSGLSRWLARRLIDLALVSYLLGMLLGGGLILLLWSGEEAQRVYHVLRPRIHWGVAELAFSLVLFALLAVWLRREPHASRSVRIARGLVAVVAATNLLYHFPPLFGLAAKVARGWTPPQLPLASADFRAELVSPSIASQSVHFALAAVTAAGIAVILLAARSGYEASQGGDDPASIARQTALRIGAWWALTPTLLQVLVGLWVLTSLPAFAQNQLLGGDLLLTALLVLSLMAAFALLQHLAVLALGDTPRLPATKSVGYFVTTVVLMTAVLLGTR